MTQFKFVPRREGELYSSNDCGIIAIDVSSYGAEPFNLLSPFTYSKDFKIPVPGMERTSCSVEGIWQGLKVIDEEMNLNLLRRKPKKRRGIVEGHFYEGELLGIEEARRLIYVPAYEYFLDNYVSDVVDILLTRQRSGEEIILYDVCDNGDIRKSEPLAHASVLSSYLNLKVLNQKVEPQNDAEKILFTILEADTYTLEQRVHLLKPLLSDEAIHDAFAYRCLEHPQNPDDYHIGEVLKND